MNQRHTLGAATAYDIQACLHDERRVELFLEAIFATVKPGDVVVDAGSGTGLLGLLAAQAGAKRVYCVEANPVVAPVVAQNIIRNGFFHQVVPVCADATKWTPPEQVDVIVSEVISAGFFYEPQLQILNNLLPSLKPGGTVIPLGMTNHIELIFAQPTMYGLQFDYDSRFRALEADMPLTTSVPYHTADFTKPNSAIISREVTVKAMVSGVANAARISYDITFPNGVIATEPTEFLLNPQIVFLPKPVGLRGRERYRVAIEYEAGGSPLDGTINVLQ
jgi:predicted RNA methylase